VDVVAAVGAILVLDGDVAADSLSVTVLGIGVTATRSGGLKLTLPNLASSWRSD
jgi:hypothetical protein